MRALTLALILAAPRLTQPSAGGSGYNTIQDESTPLTQRTTVNFTGAGVSCTDSGGITVCTITGGGAGSGFSFEESVAISGAGLYIEAVSNASVTATSKIVCRPFGTTADSLTPEAIAVSGIQVTVGDLVAGVGLNLYVWSPYGLNGTVRIHCTTGG